MPRSSPGKSALAEVVRYALKLWTAPIRYTGNGRVEIDNNAAERALRMIALGRKNFLFAIYSLIGAAKLNGPPDAYTHAVKVF